MIWSILMSMAWAQELPVSVPHVQSAADMWGVGGGGVAGLVSAVVARRGSRVWSSSWRHCVTRNGTYDSSPKRSDSSYGISPAKSRERRSTTSTLLSIHCLLLLIALRVSLPAPELSSETRNGTS